MYEDRLIRICCLLGVVCWMMFHLFFDAQTSWAEFSLDKSSSSMENGSTSVNRSHPNDPDDRYTLFIQLRRPYKTNCMKLQKMLKTESYESYAEGGEEIVLVLTNKDIGRLFQAQVRYRQVAASASNRFVSEPFLEGIKIPLRFKKLIRRVYFDPQRR